MNTEFEHPFFPVPGPPPEPPAPVLPLPPVNLLLITFVAEPDQLLSPAPHVIVLNIELEPLVPGFEPPPPTVIGYVCAKVNLCKSHFDLNLFIFSRTTTTCNDQI